MELSTDIYLEERDALYEQALDRLSGLGDLWTAISNEDFETAERLGHEYGDLLRLIEDLGWGYDPEPKMFALTMPPEQMHRLFTKVRSIAESASERDREEAEIVDEQRHMTTKITEACNRVLSVVSRIPPAEIT